MHTYLPMFFYSALVGFLCIIYSHHFNYIDHMQWNELLFLTVKLVKHLEVDCYT